MSRSAIFTLFAVLAFSTGCAQNTASTDSNAPERGDAAYYKAKNPGAGEVYVAEEPGENAHAFREMYIAPVDLGKMQIINPEGSPTDAEWEVSDVEKDVLTKAVHDEFTTTLRFDSAYNIVDSEEEADMVLHTTVVAIHPYATREEVEAGAKEGGAVTISLALVNAESGKVMVRAVDTKSTDDIWAFHQVEADPAFNLIFRSWGNSIRRSLLFLQGRSSDPLESEALVLKPQS